MKKYLFIILLVGVCFGQQDSIPNFTLPVCANGELGQDSISLYDYFNEYPCGNENNIVVLVWMPTWDSQSLSLAQSFVQDYEDYKDDGLVVLGLGMDFSPDDPNGLYSCEQYSSELGYTFPILDASGINFQGSYGFEGYVPYHVIYNYDTTETSIGNINNLPEPYSSIEFLDSEDISFNEDEGYVLDFEFTNDDTLINSNISIVVQNHNEEIDIISSSYSYLSNSGEVVIQTIQNWNGFGDISLIGHDTLCGSLDTTSILLTVLPVNDSPLDFELFSPTVLDTIKINTDTDETISFIWEPSFDVDSYVTYKLTVKLDYFGTTYINEYENIADTTFGVSAYEYAILMTNLNLPRWNIDYTIEASDGEYTIMSDDGEFVFENTSLSIKNGILPKEFVLHQNHPNPFNPITSLRYDLPNDGLVNITIYDMMGRLVKTLVNGSQTAGFKSIQWNATNDRNEPVSAGLYLYTIQAGEFRQTKKMVLLK
jgi:hypothetical protein